MSGVRWDDRTRIALVVLGVALVVMGVLATVRYQSDAGAAALVVGGLFVSLAGVAGGLTGRPATAPAESRLSAAAEAQQAGDTEGALDRFAHALRVYAPENAEYHEAATQAMYQAAGRQGEHIRPLYGFLLSPLAMSGSLVLVDIRGGTGFSLTRMQSTYQTLLVGPPAVFDAVLVVVNAPAGHATVTAVDQLSGTLGRPVVAAPWRIGDASDALADGIDRLRRAVAERGPALAPAQMAAPPAAVQPAPVQPVPVPVPAAAPPPAANPVPRQAAPQSPVAVPEPVAAPALPGPPAFDDGDAWRHATELHWQGQLQEAEGAYRSIIAGRSRALGPEHPDTLAARDQHATVLRDLDRLGEALRECEDVLLARIRALGEDHPDTLTSRSHLATIYHQLGELPQAETEHQRVLSARTRILGPNHQETLISRSNLAKVHQDLGELDRAVEEHRQVLDARSRLLGPEHRDTLMSRSLLASALHQAGRLEDSEAQHRRVLRSRLRILGPVHLDTAVSRHRLASVLHDVGRINEAISEYRAAYEVYSQLLGPNSPFARAAASDLAIAERTAARR